MSEEPWIEWTGCDCPVDVNVYVFLRSDRHGESASAYRAGEVQWDNSKRIIKLRAYKVKSPDSASPPPASVLE